MRYYRSDTDTDADGTRQLPGTGSNRDLATRKRKPRSAFPFPFLVQRPNRVFPFLFLSSIPTNDHLFSFLNKHNLPLYCSYRIPCHGACHARSAHRDTTLVRNISPFHILCRATTLPFTNPHSLANPRSPALAISRSTTPRLASAAALVFACHAGTLARTLVSSPPLMRYPHLRSLSVPISARHLPSPFRHSVPVRSHAKPYSNNVRELRQVSHHLPITALLLLAYVVRLSTHLTSSAAYHRQALFDLSCAYILVFCVLRAHRVTPRAPRYHATHCGEPRGRK